jgi:hypothetical protein
MDVSDQLHTRQRSSSCLLYRRLDGPRVGTHAVTMVKVLVSLSRGKVKTVCIQFRRNMCLHFRQS